MSHSVAVIIPTCDRPLLLERAIDSVLSQTMKVNEIIIADNGEKAVRTSHMGVEGVIFHRVGHRIGASAARNAAVLRSSSEMLLFLDDDDYFHPEYVERVVGVLRKNPSCVVYGAKSYVETGEIKVCSRSDLSLKRLLMRNPGVGGTNVATTRAVFDKIGGFDISLIRANDRAFAIDALLCGCALSVCRSAVVYVTDDAETRLRNSLLPLRHFYKKYARHTGVSLYFYAIFRLYLGEIKRRLVWK